MAKNDYFFDSKTLSYQTKYTTNKERRRAFFRYVAVLSAISLAMTLLIYAIIGSPKALLLQKENALIAQKYEKIQRNVDKIKRELAAIQQHDDEIFRPIFQIDPISNSVRSAGFGGAYRYNELKGFNHSSVLIETQKNVDELVKQVYIQNRSYNEVIEKAREQEDYLNCKPGIPPVSVEDHVWVSDYFGWRIDPFTHKPSRHYGIDICGPANAKIYATGDGVVTRARGSVFGYGRYIEIDHGFGYKSRYGHLKEYLVAEGDTIQRGQVIGIMGNTGRSTGRHLHYEVRVNNKPVNPVYFYDTKDITPDEFDKMIKHYASKN